MCFRFPPPGFGRSVIGLSRIGYFLLFLFCFFVALRVFGRTEITPGLAGGGGRE